MADYKENRPQRRPPHEDGHQQEDRPQRWSPMRTANNRKTDHKDGRHKDGRLPGRPTTKMADDTRINGHIFVNRWWKYSEGIQKGENRLCGDCEIIWPGVYAAIENCWHESMCNVYLDSADSNNFRVMSPPPLRWMGGGERGEGMLRAYHTPRNKTEIFTDSKFNLIFIIIIWFGSQHLNIANFNC